MTTKEIIRIVNLVESLITLGLCTESEASKIRDAVVNKGTTMMG